MNVLLLLRLWFLIWLRLWLRLWLCCDGKDDDDGDEDKDDDDHDVDDKKKRAISRISFSVLPTIFHTMSIWLTVGLAIQRYICICHPVLTRRFCTIENVIKGELLTRLYTRQHQLHMNGIVFVKKI